MELVLCNGFSDLTDENTFDITGGGTGLAIVTGVLTGVATVSVAVAVPGGIIIKAKAAGKVLAEGAFLTAAAYAL